MSTERAAGSGLRGWLLLILAAHLVLAAGYSVISPLGEAPDEADHWAYIVHIARERSLPTGPEMTQSKHPPLYHITAALVAALGEPSFDFMRSNPDVLIGAGYDIVAGRASGNFFIHTALEGWPWRGGALAFHLARFWSVLLSTATIWVAFAVLRQLFPGRPAVALGGAGVLAGLPEFAFIGGALNNDSAAALLGGLGLLGATRIYRAGGRFSAGWWTPVALGLGLLAKVSTVGVWPAAALAIVAGGSAGNVDGWGGAAVRGGTPVSRRLGKIAWVLAAVFGGALLCAAPWFIRNWRLYGDPLGMALAAQTVDVRSGPWTAADTAWLLRGWFLSWWGRFGGAGHIPMPSWLYAGLGLLTLVSLAGLVRRVKNASAGERVGLGLLVLAPASTALIIWRYSLLALGTDQGRLLYPAAVALAGLLAAGWLAWLPDRWQLAGAKVLSAAGMALGLYALLLVVRPAFAPPAAATIPESARSGVQAVHFGELTLAGWVVGERLDLYWRADGAPSEDWRVVLRLVAPDGSLVWERKRSPGAGRFSTDRWPPGYVMRDSYQVPWPATNLQDGSHLEVGIFRFGGEPILLDRGGEGEQRFLILERPAAALP